MLTLHMYIGSMTSFWDTARWCHCLTPVVSWVFFPQCWDPKLWWAPFWSQSVAIPEEGVLKLCPWPIWREFGITRQGHWVSFSGQQGSGCQNRCWKQLWREELNRDHQSVRFRIPVDMCLIFSTLIRRTHSPTLKDRQWSKFLPP